MEEKTQTMDTTPPPAADTEETSKHQTAKRVTTASNDPFHVQRNTLNLMPNLRQKYCTQILHQKIHSRFFKPNTTQRLPQLQKSQIDGKKRKNSPIVITS
jgi:hypothetical protein